MNNKLWLHLAGTSMLFMIYTHAVSAHSTPEQPHDHPETGHTAIVQFDPTPSPVFAVEPTPMPTPNIHPPAIKPGMIPILSAAPLPSAQPVSGTISDAEGSERRVLRTIADSEGNIFTGETQDGRSLEGYVEAKYADGRTYKGDFFGWMPNGTGEMTWTGDLTFKGTFQDGYPVKGTLRWSDNISYVTGTFVRDLPILLAFDRVKGKIKREMQIGSKLTSTIWTGEFSGENMTKGTIRFANGNSFQGRVEPNLAHVLSESFDYFHPVGTGTYTFKNGDRFTGKWSYNNTSGKITATGTWQPKKGKSKPAKWSGHKVFFSSK